MTLYILFFFKDVLSTERNVWKNKAESLIKIVNEEFEREKKEKILILEFSVSNAGSSTNSSSSTSNSIGQLRSNTDDIEPSTESTNTMGIQSDKFNKKNSIDSHEIKTVHKKNGSKKGKKRSSYENEATSDCSCDGVFVLNKIFGIS